MAKAREVMVVSPRSKKRRHHKKEFTVPIAVVAGFAPMVNETISWYKKGGWGAALATISKLTTGYNPQTGEWHFSEIVHGMGPVVLGTAVHKIVGGKLGVNRALGRAGIPFVRL